MVPKSVLFEKRQSHCEGPRIALREKLTELSAVLNRQVVDKGPDNWQGPPLTVRDLDPLRAKGRCLQPFNLKLVNSNCLY